MLPPVLNNPYLRNQMMTLLTAKVPGNSVPILPVEGAVTAGRSFWAWKRTGFLELQERLLEEIAVAGVWLFGFKAMNKFMDKAIERMQATGRLKGVYVEADWSRNFMQMFRTSAKNKPSILLSPLEAFTHNHSNLLKTMMVKGVKWGISVAVPLALVGFIIPKLNQIKTDWILKTFYAGKDPHAKGSVGHGKPHFSGAAAPLQVTDSSVAAVHNAVPQHPMMMPPPVFAGGLNHGPMIARPPIASPVYAPQGMPQAVVKGPVARPRFGFMGSQGASLLSSAAHLIENTAYGSILFIDAGLTGGRMATAWPRSKFEAFEYGARDTASLYFYIFSVPHVMKAFEKLAEQKGTWFNDLLKKVTGKNFGTVINMDQQVLERFNTALAKQLGNGVVDKAALNAAINGLNLKSLPQIREAVVPQLLRMPVSEFTANLERELLAYSTGKDASRSRQILQQVQTYLGKTPLTRRGTFSTGALETMLKHVWNETGVLKGLSDAEKFHLNTAAKLAFHHQAGLSGEALEQAVLKAAGSLSQAEQKALLANLRQSSRLGGDRVLASMLRRSVNLAHLTEQHVVRESLESLTRLAERAVLEARPIESFVADQLKTVVSEYRAYAANKTALNPVLKKAMGQLEQIVAGTFKAESPEALSKTLTQCAKALETHGSVFPKWLHWIGNPGVAHLADDVKGVLPLVKNQTGIHNLLPQQIEAQLAKLVTVLPEQSSQKALIQSYQEMIRHLQKQGGRLSLLMTESMAPSSTAYARMLNAEMDVVLKGGLRRSPGFLRQALKLMMHLPSQAEAYFDTKQFKHLESQLSRYISLVEGRVGSQSFNLSQFAQKVLKPLAQQNSRWQMGVMGVGMVISMLGVGILIPKLQNWMTKALTGTDTHPGIAAAATKTGTSAAAVA